MEKLPSFKEQTIPKSKGDRQMPPNASPRGNQNIVSGADGGGAQAFPMGGTLEGMGIRNSPGRYFPQTLYDSYGSNVEESHVSMNPQNAILGGEQIHQQYVQNSPRKVDNLSHFQRSDMDKTDNTLSTSESAITLLGYQCEAIFPTVPTPTLQSIYVDAPIIHPVTYSLFLKGFSPQQIYEYHVARNIKESGANDPAYISQISSLLNFDVFAQCRVIKSLLPTLQYPKIFLNEDTRWSRQVRENYVRLYYRIDKPVLRELLGKKLSGKERRDLDETSAKTGTTLYACRRMFDNLREVLETIREVPRDLPLSDMIKALFQLDREIAKEYAVGVFSCHHQFTLGTKTVWLKDLQYEDLEFCIETIMLHWTRQEGTDPLKIDLDLNSLREIKHYLLTYSSKLDTLVKGAITSLKVSSKTTKLLSSHLKPIVRNLIFISGKLNQKKELRDFLIDICEKFGEDCVEQCKLNADEVYQLCERLIAVFPTILDKKIKNHEKMIQAWTYFIIVVRNCLHRILEKSTWFSRN